MKQVTIPAQITSVEDKIAANLTLKQLGILLSGAILDLLVFSLIPKAFHLNFIKVILILFFFSISGSSALRIKGEICMQWFFLITKYFFRPRYYVFDKNTAQDIKINHIHQATPFPLSAQSNLFNLKPLNNIVELNLIRTKKGLHAAVSEIRK